MVNDVNLTNQQKFDKVLEAYNALEVKGDVTTIADPKFLKSDMFTSNGRFAVDWPKKMGFADETISSINRANPLPNQWDRVGGRYGENFTTLPDNGVPFTYDQRAIPYVENPSARHIGSFNNDSYFDSIDAIKGDNLEALNNIVTGNGKSPITAGEFDDLKAHYSEFIDNAATEISGIDATYGLKGNAAPWVSSSTSEVLMSGGAEQIVTPLNADMLEMLGIIPNY